VGDTSYLIAVNDSDQVHRARFKLNAAPRSVRLRGSDEAVALSAGNRLWAKFEPFGLRVYEIHF
jgi:hypothetical protein